MDRASAFSVGEAKTLRNDHAVRWSGVYIGGPCDGGSGWTKQRVVDIANATDWKFMPIYVGRQEAAICGADQLTYDQGHSDGIGATKRMRAFGWEPKRDIPVALDVEAGTYYAHPTASLAYVRGWLAAVHHEGYRGYIYSSPFALNAYHDAHARIDAAWAASYFYSRFENVTPGDLDQMGSRYRDHHNRAWQYAGDFHVSGAGDVDADTSNLLLAPRPGGTNRPATVRRAVPAACGALQIGEGLLPGESLASCDGSAVLAMDDAGELSLAIAGHTQWTAGTSGAGAVTVLSDTGALVVFDDAGNAVFDSASDGFPDGQAQLDAQGLAIVDDSGAPVWTSTAGLLVGDPAPLTDPITTEAD
ncbi:MAG TPA: glycoside hydrolase domain-containing protein [Kofleriaceae bacterium]|nr:glycoside hydrolase domain-containing protein [Kofleriaceae bacterium]